MGLSTDPWSIPLRIGEGMESDGSALTVKEQLVWKLPQWVNNWPVTPRGSNLYKKGLCRTRSKAVVKTMKIACGTITSPSASVRLFIGHNMFVMRALLGNKPYWWGDRSLFRRCNRMVLFGVHSGILFGLLVRLLGSQLAGWHRILF